MQLLLLEILFANFSFISVMKGFLLDKALKHPYFRDLREQDKPVKKIASPPSLRTPEGDSAGGEDSKHGE